MSWDGFDPYVREDDRGTRLLVSADTAGPEEDQPLAVLQQPGGGNHGIFDLVELTEEEILWLRDDVFPGVLDRMRAAREGTPS